jgi:hypothetical protein
MRKWFTVVAGVMVASALVAAQAKSPAVKKVKEEVTFSEDVKVGATVLKSGRYQVTSSSTGNELTFKRLVPDVSYPGIWVFDMKEKPVVVACTVTSLPEKSHGTAMDMPADSGGVRVLKTLTLDDTNLTFTIGQ